MLSVVEVKLSYGARSQGMWLLPHELMLTATAELPPVKMCSPCLPPAQVVTTTAWPACALSLTPGTDPGGTDQDFAKALWVKTAAAEIRRLLGWLQNI